MNAPSASVESRSTPVCRSARANCSSTQLGSTMRTRAQRATCGYPGGAAGRGLPVGLVPISLSFVVEPAYTVKALDESTWADFTEGAGLVEANNGVFGGCWCMGFHPEGADKEATPALNRERKLSRVRAGSAHAALVFDGQACVGWCQFGPPDEVPRITSRAAYEKGRADPPDWRIACCFVGKGHRRQGVAASALAGAIELIAGLGGGNRRGLPRGCRIGARRLPLQRCPVDLRTARLYSRPEDRQAPLGRDQGR